MKHIFNPSAVYSVDTDDKHYDKDFYQVISRTIRQEDGDSYRSQITFCGSDKEARLLASAEDMYNLLSSLITCIDNSYPEEAEEIANLLNRINNA